MMILENPRQAVRVEYGNICCIFNEKALASDLKMALFGWRLDWIQNSFCLFKFKMQPQNCKIGTVLQCSLHRWYPSLSSPAVLQVQGVCRLWGLHQMSGDGQRPLQGEYLKMSRNNTMLALTATMPSSTLLAAREAVGSRWLSFRVTEARRRLLNKHNTHVDFEWSAVPTNDRAAAVAAVPQCCSQCSWGSETQRVAT